MEETLRRQGIEYRVVDSRRGELKTCYFCKVETPVECFSVKMRFRKDVNPPTVYFGYSSYSSYCINCQPKKMKDYYEREKSSGKWNLYSRANGLKKYGLTEDDYNDLLEAQGGGCAICGVVAFISQHQRQSRDHRAGLIKELVSRIRWELTCDGTAGPQPVNAVQRI